MNKTYLYLITFLNIFLLTIIITTFDHLTSIYAQKLDTNDTQILVSNPSNSSKPNATETAAASTTKPNATETTAASTSKPNATETTAASTSKPNATETTAASTSKPNATETTAASTSKPNATETMLLLPSLKLVNLHMLRLLLNFSQETR